MLCSTNQRILLVDKKPMFLTLEDVRYDMIAEIQFSHRLLDATIRIFTPTKSLVFTSWNRAHLRKLTMGAQQHVMAIRQYAQQVQSMQQQQFQQQFQQPVPQPQQLSQQLPPGPVAELTPMTMPNPTEQAPSPYDLDPAFTPASASADSSTGSPQGQPIMPFSPAMNPFLRSPLITRNRGGYRRW